MDTPKMMTDLNWTLRPPHPGPEAGAADATETQRN
jgi:hypothetical protein